MSYRIGAARFFGGAVGGAEPLFGETLNVLRLTSLAGGSATGGAVPEWLGGALTIEYVLSMETLDPANTPLLRIDGSALDFDYALDRQGGAGASKEMRWVINGGAGQVNDVFSPGPASPDFPTLNYIRYSYVLSGIITSPYQMTTYANGNLILASPFAAEGAGFGVWNQSVLNSAVIRNFRISDLRMWNVARTAGEIAADWNIRLTPPYSSDLFRYWRLDDGAGNPVDEIVGQSLVLGGAGAQWISDTIATGL